MPKLKSIDINKPARKHCPNIDDVIATVMGPNAAATIKHFVDSRNPCFKATIKSVEQTKLKSKKVEPEYPKVPKKHYPHPEMFELASSLPTVPNTKYLDRDIWKRLACKGIEKVYQSCFWKLTKEVRQEFVTATHAIGVICVVAPPDESREGHIPELPYKYLGKTSNYKNYLKIIKRFESRLLITLPLLRRILYFCVEDLPKCSFSLNSFRDRTYDISELYTIFDEEIKKKKDAIQQWYQKIVEYVRKDKGKFPKQLSFNVYRAGTVIIAIFISKSIINTLEHIIEVTKSGEEIPFINMSMQYHKKVVLQPSILKLCHLYAHLIKNMCTVGHNLPSLEAHFCDGHAENLIPDYVADDVRDMFEKKAKHNIVLLFLPINFYINTLNSEFACVYREREKWNKDRGKIDQPEGVSEKTISTVESEQENDSYSQLIEIKERADSNEERMSVIPMEFSELLKSNEDESQQKIRRETFVEQIRRESLMIPFDYSYKSTSTSKTSQVSSKEAISSGDLLLLLNDAEDEDDEDVDEIENDMTFEEGYDKVDTYRSYLDKLAIMVDIEFYLVGQLIQSSCRDAITEALHDMIEKVAKKLVMQHIWLNEDICENFEMIKTRALTIPQSTEELIEMGSYMLWAATDYLAELTERLELSISVTVNLMEMTTLTRDHLDLNTKTICWLEDIKPIIDKNASIFENCKSDLEERLQSSQAKLLEGIQQIIPSIEILNMMDEAENSRAYMQQLAPLMSKVREYDDLLTWINKEEVLFKFPITLSQELTNIKNHLYPFYHLVRMCFTVVRKTETWLYGPFEFLEHSSAEALFDETFKELIKTQKLYKTKIRQAAADSSLFRFYGIIDHPDFTQQPAPLKLCTKATEMIRKFKPSLQMMSIMSNDAMLQRHWDEMSEIAGFDITPNAGTTLNKFMEMGILPEIEKYEIISVGAIKERQLFQNLISMQAEWDNVMFKTATYKDTGIHVLTAIDDIQALLDDHIIKALTMRGSVFVKPYQSIVYSWYDKIMRTNATMEEWTKVQTQWIYLLPIFSSRDIVSQMPEEGQLFKEVDSTYRRYVNLIIREPKVIDNCPQPGLLEAMINCTQILDRINEGVAAYLEKKRIYFPRFFFLSNDEMLEILSETKDPLRVQTHLRKCFEGINRLEFDQELKIHAMFSEEQERVDFLEIIDTVAARGSVEKWLVEVETQMLIAVQDQTYLSWQAYPQTERAEWCLDWPEQVVLAVSQIYWSLNIHHVLNSTNRNAIQEFLVKLKVQLNDIVSLIRSTEITNVLRITIKALIVIDVHAKDVTQELFANQVKSDAEFKWLAQLRYYWEESCIVRMINAIVKYGCEYLGNSDRLVITPLTDRCYRTLIGAYYLHLNGAPEGPAGTGKTETTKDLAKALAVQCVVFNCSDGLDYKAMGKFFKGLAASGAWACFDEFNRIEVEVLSVVAQQILSIMLAIRAHVETFIFEGTELRLNPACYVCITMNPGYAGRSELPDNLKVLFRTVAMMVPDYAMIGEISLYSYGFMDARTLSVKIVTTYRLCSEQLSSQNHYDYGMRAVKSVLWACGNNKRKYPFENEDILLLRSILDVNLPKFLSHDVPLFEGIISDLFPRIVLPAVDYSTFINSLSMSCKKRNLQVKECVVTKIIQTYEMMIVRHGFMLVGEPYAGKTVTLKVLADTLTHLHSIGERQLAVQYQFVNPKAITMGQLYGQFDPISYEWFDGIVANSFRSFASDTCPDRKWLIFDGPVDAVWIENMNTVLDDSKKLCLMSGEVVAMTNVMSMIFEAMDLSQASPATVSRCGMIYMEPSTLGWKPHVDSWLPTCPSEWMEGQESYISGVVDWAVPPSLYFIRKQCNQLCNVGEVSLVKNMITIIEMTLTDAYRNSNKKEDDIKFIKLWIQATFMIAMVWGLGSTLDSRSREKFDLFVRNLWDNTDKENPYPVHLDRIDVPLPETDLLFDYLYVYRGKGSWKYWPDVVKTIRADETRNVQQIMVPTIDSIKYVHMINTHIKHKVPVLLIGPTGTGKSFYLQDLLMNKLDSEKYEPAFVTFTVKITANQTQDLIISKLQKRRRGNYGPPRGKLCVIFIDDVNMPVKETYGAQPPIELLRQYFDHKNWYDLKETFPIYLHDILIIGAMGPPGGSRQDVYQRFLRHFIIYSINEFSDETMTKIYSNVLLLGWKNNGFPSDVISSVHQVVNATLDMYKSAVINLLPTPAKSHYIFNLRDFSRIIGGCAMLKKESFDNKTMFAKIWVHEVLRVIYDRLTDPVDKEWVFRTLKVVVKMFFKEQFDVIFEHLQEENGEVTEQSLQKLMFGTYLDTEGMDNDLRYEEVVSMVAFLRISEAALEEYNATHKNKMDIVLFKYALEHLSRVCRVLSIPSGSALLVGISGSGRQSLTKLATTITGHSFFQPEITKNYGMNEWREDLKRVVKEAGGLGKHTVFLFTEGQIKEEGFLQDIEGLLNSGEVPNLFQIEEKQEVMELVRLAAQGGNRNLDISPLSIFSFFIKRTREKLHIILCFSPIGSSFRVRLRLYPSLINCCTLDWFEDWPEDALEKVAKNWMTNVNLTSEIKESAITTCKYFHVTSRKYAAAFFRETNRRTYITSASYLELIKIFTDLTNGRQLELMKNKGRYVVGLEKLQFAAEQILQMQIDLETFQPQLQMMSKRATEMMGQIEKETMEVERISGNVKKDEEKANVEAAEAQALKTECEADLALAIPILEEAIGALNTLKPADITLVKSMKNPPEPIKLVMAAVCVMKDVKPDRIRDPSTGRMKLDYWGPSKRLLGDISLLQSLKDFDKDNIKPDIIHKIRKEYLPQPNFKPVIVAKASSAAEGLCKWIIAIDMYEKIAKVVGPKKIKLELAEKKRKVAEFKESPYRRHGEKKDLQDRVTLCGEKLVRAKKLIGGLGGEKNRWTAAANNLQAQYDGVAGDILMSSGMIAYLSAFNMRWRLHAFSDWLKFVREVNIPVSSTYDFATTLGNELKIQDWYIAGLPRDAFSTGNAIIQDNSKRWSLLIDPQLQANLWIKNMEKKNDVHVTKFSDGNYMKIVEYCIEAGKPVLIENIHEDLEAPLDPLLYKAIFKSVGTWVVAIGENLIPYHKNFKLYLTSKMRNPHYLPEVFNKVTIINFALTVTGLEDQLQGIVVTKERPDLQRKREELIIESAENKSALAKTEENILRTLSESKGDILEDESAIRILDQSKLISIDIIAKQVVARTPKKRSNFPG
ncbi:hypothetical protein FQA39_LY01194 [Lamprigera yunnana]|nr:hypothetical protein FQA39_LY01194 [Lamprigera yunnana]